MRRRRVRLLGFTLVGLTAMVLLSACNREPQGRYMTSDGKPPQPGNTGGRGAGAPVADPKFNPND